MECLSEIAGLSVGTIYDDQFRYMYIGTIRQLTTFLPTSISTAFVGATRRRYEASAG